MMRRYLTMLVPLLAAVQPLAASAQTGYYQWSISASVSDPNVNNPPNPGAGVQTLYLWLVEQCYPGTSGLAAAQFRLVGNKAPSTWTVLGFTPMNSFLNAGNATDLLLATPCTSGPVVAGSILALASGGPGRVGLTLTDGTGGGGIKAAGVDCLNFQEHSWPGLMRFNGYATQDAGAPQDHGNGCTTTAVEQTSWGQVKGLYR